METQLTQQLYEKKTFQKLKRDNLKQIKTEN